MTVVVQVQNRLSLSVTKTTVVGVNKKVLQHREDVGINLVVRPVLPVMVWVRVDTEISLLTLEEPRLAKRFLRIPSINVVVVY